MSAHATKSERIQLYGGAGVAIVLLTLGSYGLCFRPLQRRQAERIERQAQLSELRQTAFRHSSALVALNRQLATARKDLESAPLRLQPATRINQRLDELARLAHDCGLALNEIQPGAATTYADYQTVAIRISGSGTYPAVASFLHTIRQSFPDTGVRSFDSANTSPADGKSATFRFDLLWFTTPANAVAATRD